MSAQTTYTETHTVAIEGALADNGPRDVATGINEAAGEIPFGVMVAKGTGDRNKKLPAAGSDTLDGIALHGYNFDKSEELGTTGIKRYVAFNVLRRGRAWVKVEEAVNDGDRAHIRHTANGGNTQLGAFRKSADGGNTIDATNIARFETTAGAGELAIVMVDMTGIPNAAP